jgi:hypothetical protein
LVPVAIDSDALKDWVRRAIAATEACARGGIGKERIGRLLSRAPGDADGFWPHSAVGDLIEEIATKDFEDGIEVGVFNNRGVFTKSLTEGGRQEHAFAEQYSASAVAVAHRWPRTASMLRRLADRYRAYGREEDTEAELRQDGIWS